MVPNERREKMIEYISQKRHTTIHILADEFGVSWDTAYRDMIRLEEQYPLIVSRGNGGGVALPEGYYASRKYLTPKQETALRSCIQSADPSDQETLYSILADFAWQHK